MSLKSSQNGRLRVICEQVYDFYIKIFICDRSFYLAQILATWSCACKTPGSSLLNTFSLHRLNCWKYRPKTCCIQFVTKKYVEYRIKQNFLGLVIYIFYFAFNMCELGIHAWPNYIRELNFASASLDHTFHLIIIIHWACRAHRKSRSILQGIEAWPSHCILNISIFV